MRQSLFTCFLCFLLSGSFIHEVHTSEEQDAKQQAKALLNHLQAVGDHFYADRVQIVGLEFDAISARVRVENSILHITDITAQLYGGTAKAQIDISMVDGTIDIALDISSLQLDQFLTRYGSMETPPVGSISGTVQLHLPKGIGNLLVGRADLQMTGGNVVSLGSVTDVLMGNPGADKNQDTAKAVIQIANRHATFEEFTIKNPSVNLFGTGSIAFDGQTNITFSPHTKPGYLRFLPIAGDILRWGIGNVTESIGRFQVKGHISNPQFIARPF